MNRPDWLQAPKRFILAEDYQDPLNGDEVDLAEFYAANDFSPDVVNRIGRMVVGDVLVIGGGAAPLFSLVRVA